MGQSLCLTNAFGFGFLLQLQDMCSQSLESRFRGIAEQRVLVRGQGRRDFGPILRPQRLHGRREEVAIFHLDVTPLVFQEIANDGVHVMPKELAVGEHTVNRFCDAAQTLGPFFMLTRKIADFRCRDGIAESQLGKNPIFLRMVVQLGIDFEIRNDRPDDLIVRPLCATEDVQLVFEDGEQTFNIAVFPA